MLRAQVTALARVPKSPATPLVTATETETDPVAAQITAAGALSGSEQQGEQQAAEALARRAARYAWALLLARIHEVFPLSAHAAAARCESSPSSPTPLPSARS